MTESESFLDGKVILHPGDCLDVLKTLDPNSVDSIVTDPPYGLEFMGKGWDGADGFRRSLNKADVDRKSVFGRTSRRGPEYRAGRLLQVFVRAVAREAIRVLKPGGHIVAFGGTRTYHRLACAVEDAGFEIRDQLQWMYGQGFAKVGYIRDSDEVIVREGWAGSLKPAVEPICFARKPLTVTVAANMRAYGTGALNIDGCRVAVTDADARDVGRAINRNARTEDDGYGMNRNGAERVAAVVKAEGRWPANVIHDGSDEVVGAFPDVTTHGGGTSSTGFWQRDDRRQPIAAGDSGSAARFFYTAKADQDDRLGSKHPTVKPLDLMQWLVRLVTPPKGLVLDPFAGTGTTGEAAFREGMRAILIEREEEYCNDIRSRMAHALAGPQERKRTIAKAKHGSKPVNDGLFAALGDQT